MGPLDGGRHANTLGGTPQAVLRWATGDQNGTSTGGEAWSLLRLYGASMGCVTEDKDPFLVIPLTDDTKPDFVPLPPSFHLCPN